MAYCCHPHSHQCHSAADRDADGSARLRRISLDGDYRGQNHVRWYRPEVVHAHPVDAVVRRQEGSHIPSAELGILEVAALILSRRVYDKGAPTRRTSRV